MQDFRNIVAWRKSHDLMLATYRATKTYPVDERFGLVKQMRKAAVSIECNIAEGSNRCSDPDFRRFLYMSLGSLAELECQAIISRDLKYLTPGEANRLIVGVIQVRGKVWPLVERLTASIIRSAAEAKRGGGTESPKPDSSMPSKPQSSEPPPSKP